MTLPSQYLVDAGAAAWETSRQPAISIHCTYIHLGDIFEGWKRSSHPTSAVSSSLPDVYRYLDTTDGSNNTSQIHLIHDLLLLSINHLD